MASVEQHPSHALPTMGRMYKKQVHFTRRRVHCHKPDDLPLLNGRDKQVIGRRMVGDQLVPFFRGAHWTLCQFAHISPTFANGAINNASDIVTISVTRLTDSN